MNTLRFDDRVAIVTGAGRGLGEQYALELARRGGKVVVNDPGAAMDGGETSERPADAVVAAIRAAGGTAIANYASVTDRDGAASMVEGALEHWGRLDILINNAGILRDKSFHKKDLDDFQAVLDVHLMGTVNVTREAWPVMRENGYGRVVVTSSGSGILGNFGQSDYGAAKLGVVGLMNCLKYEGASKNVHINAIKPAAGTRMAAGIVSDEIMHKLRPQLITPAVLYLCTEQAPNGMILQAAGGHFSRVNLCQNEGVEFEGDVSLEDFAARYDQIAADGPYFPVKHQETE